MLYIFDADGTLRRCTVPGQPCPNKPNEWELIPGVRERFQKMNLGPGGDLVAIASNQMGVAKGYLSLDMAYQLLKDCFTEATQRWPLQGLLELCPHDTEVGCWCRKPQPGMLLTLMTRFDYSRRDTLFIGDQDSDLEAAARAGVRFSWAKDFFGST